MEAIEAGHVDDAAPAWTEAKKHLYGRIRPDAQVKQAMPFRIEKELDASRGAGQGDATDEKYSQQ